MLTMRDKRRNSSIGQGILAEWDVDVTPVKGKGTRRVEQGELRL